MEQKKFRLNNNEYNSICSAFNKFFNIKKSILFLFGSRTDINQKGGDIDLLIVLPDNEFSKNNFSKIMEFETYLKKLIGERKIDTKLINISEYKKPKTPFIKVIKPSLIKLSELT